MNTPIKREDIRKGDRFRRIVEMTAPHDLDASPADDATYELIERPVTLPTVPQTVISWESPYCKNLATLERADQWLHSGQKWTAVGMAERIADTAMADSPFTLLRPVAEVAAEVMAALDVDNIIPHGVYTRSYTGAQLHAIAAKFGVTK